jgi:hypothetical protein
MRMPAPLISPFPELAVASKTIGVALVDAIVPDEIIQSPI